MTDSSLNGNDTFELVSPILVGEAGLRELEKVCWVLDLCDVKVNESCGLHVHIDAAGFSMALLLLAIALPLASNCIFFK